MTAELLEKLTQTLPGSAQPTGSPAHSLPEFGELQSLGSVPSSQRDWQTIFDVSVELLSNKTKDIRVFSELLPATARLHGLPGVAASVAGLKNLIDTYGPALHPDSADSDRSTLKPVLLQLDESLNDALRNSALITEPNRLSLAAFEATVVLEEQLSKYPQDAALMLSAKPLRLATCNALISQIGDDHSAPARLAFSELRGLLSHTEENSICVSLNSWLDAVGTENHPLPKSSRCMELMIEHFPLLDRAQSQSGSEINNTDLPKSAESGAPGAAGSRVSAANTSADYLERKQAALTQLSEIEAMFRHYEPHSPVAGLLNQAVKWAHMPIGEWLGKVIRDEGTLNELTERLGLNTSQTDQQEQHDD